MKDNYFSLIISEAYSNLFLVLLVDEYQSTIVSRDHPCRAPWETRNKNRSSFPKKYIGLVVSKLISFPIP